MCGDPSLQEAIKPERTNPFRETEEEYDAERGERECKKWLWAASGGSKSVARLGARLLRWWLGLLHAVNRQFRFVKVKTAIRPDIAHQLVSSHPLYFSMGALERAATLAPVGSPPTAGVIIIIFEEKENDAQKI